jgi:tripartite-type tricarboxylate transporter receptor subunit TctC
VLRWQGSTGFAASAAALFAAPRITQARNYPARPVRLIVGFPPDGAADITARLIGQWLSERLGQQFVVENRPGAGTNIATETVVRAAPDGYTLLLVSVANTVNATLYEKLGFNFIADIAPVAALIRGPLVMEVNPSVPARTVCKESSAECHSAGPRSGSVASHWQTSSINSAS